VYRALLKELGEGLRAGRYALAEAAERLAATQRGKDPHWLAGLASRYPGRALQERFAAHFSVHAVSSPEGDRHTASCLARRLEREFERTYGGPPPHPFDTLLPAAWVQGRVEGGATGRRNPDNHFPNSANGRPAGGLFLVGEPRE
jgi:hypothetical protein